MTTIEKMIKERDRLLSEAKEIDKAIMIMNRFKESSDPSVKILKPRNYYTVKGGSKALRNCAKEALIKYGRPVTRQEILDLLPSKGYLIKRHIMITNEKQYKISKAQAAKFLESIESFDEKSLQTRKIDPRIIKAQRDALESQYESLREEIEQYELLKSGKAGVLELNNLTDLPDLLIKARIAQGFTQADLAQKLDMKPQQIQRYESERYSSASMRRLLEIASVLNIQTKENAATQQMTST